MSQGRQKQSHWGEVLEEVIAQQTLVESILHPGKKSSGGRTSLSLTTSSYSPQRHTDMMTPQRERSSMRAASGGQLALLSPSLDATGGEARSAVSHSGNLADADRDAPKDMADGHRGGSAAENGSKVVEALMEALSTSSWSSDSNTALPTAPDDGIPVPQLQPARVAPLDRITTHAPPPDYEGEVSDMTTAQSGALQAVALYVRATQIVAREFAVRQQIMFNEFTAVTELISLFVCRMSQNFMRS
ncbi:hypothetical protein ABB37_03163 [Leptomonas pyrrhocoris]|uniref:Uncharacterized protein n=1 Tax=Leptomonas pyrrhocoris TaxID=157538 RepID=A0A0M9G4J3_LEPPY|nr:hypothetical protein ABB37_03163 [Leptomonas pyrrhocoris]KPA81979.1 hypothetical protein ABB37_03163 [Leptomonas pyrrhocoris]|eukprot:XP_015660418.1 hypothetical protein ABB37_03163 [Leptomonas pyrrhocoris]